MSEITARLQQLIRESDQPLLLVADENIDAHQLRPKGTQDLALTNRWDQFRSLKSAGWKVHFSDFDWPAELPLHSRFIYRISKERAVAYHLINQAAEHLAPDSEMFLLGRKGEGIKTYAKKAQQRLGGERSEEKLNKDLWLVRLTVGKQLGELLDDQQYSQLREVTQIGNRVLRSKPGVFGWNKIDQGSQLLIEQLPLVLNCSLPLGKLSVLDLGCGSGYLTLASCSAETQILSTDNNAAALEVTTDNLKQAQLNFRVTPSDAGKELNEKFDLILCNPPFHSGFGVDHDLTDKFSREASRLLATGGTALFVVNQHVPLSRIALNHFRQVNLVINNGHFCVYSLTNSKQ